MKKALFVSALVVAIAAAVLIHERVGGRGKLTTEPVFADLARSVTDNELSSPRDPRAVLRFDPAFRHLGGQKFVLYGVADTEQHFFVETTADNALKSLYWVQFEEYLPDNSYTYDYEDSPGRLQLGDLDFYVDTQPVRSNPKKRRRGTDGALARQFVQSKGYAFPDDFAYARLVHLTDGSRRKELMIIFIEDLAPLALGAPELAEGGEHAARWPVIEDAHLAKIRRTLSVAIPR